MDAALCDVPLTTWKCYLSWHLVNEPAPYPSDAFVQKDFDFYHRKQRGTQEMHPRWKRMIDQTSAALGEALGQVYVTRAFPPASKVRADEMIENLRGAIRVRLTKLKWMGPETKKQALS